MKLCRLKLKNLNSFRREIDINFEEPVLADASIVAITGPTGAGKTTLLDAICVALYGKTPRLTGGKRNQNRNHLVSHGEKHGVAEIHFIANGTRYIATCSINRNSAPKVQLSYAADGKLISDKLTSTGKSLGSSQKSVSQEVEAILGLDFMAFKRSVMLAQGEFAAFLKAIPEDRRQILEATAGISIYDTLKNALDEKVKAADKANTEILDKLKQIPEASHTQLGKAQTHLNSLESEAEALNAKIQKIQREKDLETKRKADYENLLSSQKRRAELLDTQQQIDTLRAERENAEQARDLRAEKREYDTATSDLKEAKAEHYRATTEKTGAEEQVKIDQANFDKKATYYQTALTEYKQKVEVYTNAKLDVERAADQSDEAESRKPKLTELESQIGTLSNQLINRKVEQTKLQKQINEAQTFLNQNQLPSDRQHRLNRANTLLVQLESHQGQLETVVAAKDQHAENAVSLKDKIKALSEIYEKQRVENADAKTRLDTTTSELNKLRATGTREEWIDRKRQAAQAHPLVQRYEKVLNDLEYFSERTTELSDTGSTLNVELVQIEEELQEKVEVCRSTTEAVEHCEVALRTVMLSNPINQLRQRLHTGEPCLVCGATEHPFAGTIEADSENLIQDAENALANAKADRQTAQNQMQNLRTQRDQLQQNQHNVLNQCKELWAKAVAFQGETETLEGQWREVYPDLTISFDWVEEDIDVSSDWIAEQVGVADTAITELRDAEQVQTEASHAYQTTSHQLETTENQMKREQQLLKDAEAQLQEVDDAIADSQADIIATEERFWALLPENFHEHTPAAALDSFREKVEEVATRSDECRDLNTNLERLNDNIKTSQRDLENLQANRAELQTEIETYQRNAEALLSTVREKTRGLETADEINAAIGALETELQSKENARDDAQQQLKNNQHLLTQTQTAHQISENRHANAQKKCETAQKVYLEKLRSAGFDSPKAHADAFRDEAQLQALTHQIDDYHNEMQQLERTITELKTLFGKTPFDSEALTRIESEAEKTERMLKAAHQKTGGQQEEIKNLKDALEKRQALDNTHRKTQHELDRWQRLDEVIPSNTLRDFALEIMFKQMGKLANKQLDYLTSQRYQLKIQSIGDLTIIDRWNANEERPVQTLSGGESFLTSLALALALTDLSSGRAQLHSLFLDEGFGTLDTQTLDTAIAALEGLRMQGRSIFLISHVQELTRRIPVKINVKKHGDGSSSVQIQN